MFVFTHYHADHISGLPGLLLTMGNAQRTEPVVMVGPKGLARVVDAMRTIAPELPFEIIYRELTKPVETLQLGGYQITAYRVNHNVICYGYTLEIPRAGKFDVERAKALQLPVQMWNPLQKGREIIWNHQTYTPDMVRDRRAGDQDCLLHGQSPDRTDCGAGKGSRSVYLRGDVCRERKAGQSKAI